MTFMIDNDVLVRLVRNDSQHTEVGYGFATASTQSDADQEQRWILFVTELHNEMPPNKEVVIEVPRVPARPFENVRTMRDFQQAVAGNFRPERDLYVKTNVKHLTAHCCIPRPMYVPPFLPPAPSGGSQPDIGTCQIRPMGIVADRPMGYVFTRSPNWHETIEYWMLFDWYVAPASGLSLRLGDIRSGEDFADLFDIRQWSSNATLAVAANRYHPTFPVGAP